jgi:hypothetical protein
MKCLVCKRISPKIVFDVSHKIFHNNLSKHEIHSISVKAIKIINCADKKNRIFFCGKTKRFLLSGLFYILAVENNTPLSQHFICVQLLDSEYELTELSIRKAYRYWLKNYSYLFPTFKDKYLLLSGRHGAFKIVGDIING